MRNILCRQSGIWYLAGFSDELRWIDTFGVSTLRWLPHHSRYSWNENGDTIYTTLSRELLSEFDFFPSPRCHSRRIWIEGWSRESLTPKLRCHAGFNYPEVVRGNAVASELAKWDQWKQWALAHGWIKGWESHHGTTESEACAELSPEDLELEEGPPPAGEFRPGPQ